MKTFRNQKLKYHTSIHYIVSSIPKENEKPFNIWRFLLFSDRYKRFHNIIALVYTNIYYSLHSLYKPKLLFNYNIITYVHNLSLNT